MVSNRKTSKLRISGSHFRVWELYMTGSVLTRTHGECEAASSTVLKFCHGSPPPQTHTVHSTAQCSVIYQAIIIINRTGDSGLSKRVGYNPGLSWHFASLSQVTPLCFGTVHQTQPAPLHFALFSSDCTVSACICPLRDIFSDSGVPGGGFGCSNPPPPRNSEGPPKNRAKLNPIVKTVKKIAEFRTPTHQDVRKKR